jgi:hypothetical protein
LHWRCGVTSVTPIDFTLRPASGLRHVSALMGVIQDAAAAFCLAGGAIHRDTSLPLP